MRFRTGLFDQSQELFVTFEEFVATRLDALVRYATVVTWDPHLAEDITQDVLVQAQARWARIGRLDLPGTTTTNSVSTSWQDEDEVVYGLTWLLPEYPTGFTKVARWRDLAAVHVDMGPGGEGLAGRRR